MHQEYIVARRIGKHSPRGWCILQYDVDSQSQISEVVLLNGIE